MVCALLFHVNWSNFISFVRVSQFDSRNQLHRASYIFHSFASWRILPFAAVTLNSCSNKVCRFIAVNEEKLREKTDVRPCYRTKPEIVDTRSRWKKQFTPHTQNAKVLSIETRRKTRSATRLPLLGYAHSVTWFDLNGIVQQFVCHRLCFC